MGASAAGCRKDVELSCVESEVREGREKKEYCELGRLWCDDDVVVLDEECKRG